MISPLPRFLWVIKKLRTIFSRLFKLHTIRRLIVVQNTEKYSNMKLLLYLSFGSFLLSTSFAAPIQGMYDTRLWSLPVIELISNIRCISSLHRDHWEYVLSQSRLIPFEYGKQVVSQNGLTHFLTVLHRRRNDADADADADIVYPVADYRKLHLRQRQHEDADADVDIVYTAPREGSANSWAQRNSRQRRQDAVDADVDIVYTAPEEGTPNSRAFKPWSRRDDDSDADADADIVYTAPGGIKSGLWRIPPTV